MNEKTAINTYNESSLHNTLKNMYAIQTEGNTEIAMEGHIYDVVGKSGEIIEIQTKNLSRLFPKIGDSLEKGLKVKLVHPIIRTKYIQYDDENGNEISKRKSPRQGSIYDLFSELTAIYPILLHENFTLEILEITMIEKRMKLNTPQKQNKRQRFQRDYLKTNKYLDEILQVTDFKTKEDYLSLFPATLPKEFCAKDLSEEFKKYNQFPKTAYKQANLILWVYSRMDLIEYIGKKGRSKFYRINQN